MPQKTKIMAVTIFTGGNVEVTRFNNRIGKERLYSKITPSSQDRLREFGHSAYHHITFAFSDRNLALLTIWNHKNIGVA